MTRRMNLSLLALATGLLTLNACSGGVKRYALEGEVVGLDPATKNAKIKHGKIEGFMDAMTMEYTVKPDADFDKLHTGDHIRATVVVQDPIYWVTDVKVIGTSSQ